MKTKNYKKIVKQILLGLIALLLLVIVTLVVKNATKKITTYEVKDTAMYQYFGEQRFDYNTNLTINKENEITKLLVDNEEVILSSDPFYYAEERKILFPMNMSIIIPSSNLLQLKIPFYTILDGTMIKTYLRNADNEYFIDDAIVYDGNDLYVFPFETTLLIDEEEYNLSPFSYVIVNYNNKTCFYYDYEQGNAKIVSDIKNDVFASNGNYKINLSIDSIENNGKQRLLMKNADYLDSVFK